jgi:hypothetical protein
MEPSSLTPPFPGEDDLEARLRADTGPDLPDDGFALRVLAALPPPRPALRWRGLLVPATGAAIGLAVAFLRGERWPDLASIAAAVNSLSQALTVNPWSIVAFGVALTALTLACCGAWVEGWKR